MKKRTREDKKRANENRITYVSPVGPSIKRESKTSYGEFNSIKDLTKSLIVSILMFGLLYACYLFWR